MGPCRISRKSPLGVCGANADTIVARNFLRAVAAGVSALRYFTRLLNMDRTRKKLARCISLTFPHLDARSIETANSVAKMAGELGIKIVGVIGNKITDKSQIDVIKSGLAKQDAAAWLGALPYSKAMQQADLKREPVIDADKRVVEELKKAKNKLMELISG